MGNCCFLLRPTQKTRSCHVLQITKIDGKILEYRDPVLVKDVLLNHTGHKISVSRKSTQNLPLHYQLKLGKRYYLLPLIDEQRPIPTEDVRSGSSKRIKVIVTKQQLQELLKKKISLEDVLSMPRKNVLDGADSVASWRPKLETVPEETSS
ncbi:hypothetical protein ACLOJK_004807 [Asimina triloba]